MPKYQPTEFGDKGEGVREVRQVPILLLKLS
jgi:hypothetical protein